MFPWGVERDNGTKYTAKNSVILPSFPVWKFYGKTQFLQSFGRIELLILILSKKVITYIVSYNVRNIVEV